MRFHLLGFASVPLDKEFSRSPFATLAFDMARMIKKAGHELIIYGTPLDKAPCDEHVDVVSDDMLASTFQGGVIRPDTITWQNDVKHPAWQEFRLRAEVELARRYATGDIALISYGNFMNFVPNVAPLHCEFMCGYSGVFSGFRVFPSYSWMHYLYGEMKLLNDGNWYDAVIQHYLDVDDFAPSQKKGDYLFFMARLNPGKGPDIAIDIARAAGMKIVVGGVPEAGPPGVPDWLKNRASLPGVEFIGHVSQARRRELMAGARAFLAPTRWMEAFGMTTIEAYASGTPVISSDWGAFPETVEHGVTGFRCRDMDEFVRAVKDIDSIDPARCRRVAEGSYGLDAAWPKYEHYFRRLIRQLGQGWYETHSDCWRGDTVQRWVTESCNGKDTIAGVEVGTNRGELAAWLLRALPKLHLTMVDQYIHTDIGYLRTGDPSARRTPIGAARDAAEAAVRVAFAADRAKMVLGPSCAAANDVAAGSLDFVFLDGDHRRASVMQDLLAWWPRLRKGGLFCGHDWENPNVHGENGVRDAVSAFAEKMNLAVELGADWTWALREREPTDPQHAEGTAQP